LLWVTGLLYSSYFYGFWKHVKISQLQENEQRFLRGKNRAPVEMLEKLPSTTVAETQQTSAPASIEMDQGTDRLHTFYYPWYRNINYDGYWMHWNHEHLEHWDEHVRKQYPKFQHDPNLNDIGSSYYPALGPYSSADPTIMEAHMRQLRSAMIGVIVVSWLPAHHSANERIDQVILPLLNTAHRFGLEVCLHLEPYVGRTATSVASDVTEAIERFTTHSAYYRLNQKPVFYAYDSYQIPSHEWSNAFQHLSSKVYLIALVLTERHLQEYVLRGPFDAAYSYFGATGFTPAATPSNWNSLVARANAAHKQFIPCVSPGYDDLRVRPWNGQNKRERQDGKYYDDYWRAAIASKATLVAITSFNEFHEGTQIEEVQPGSSISIHRQGIAPYDDYGQNQPSTFYLDRTKIWASEFLLKN